MRAFKTKSMAQIARRQGIGDDALVEAINRAESGLINADLGGGLIKQRVARPGGGRSGGHRVLIAFRKEERAIVIYAFAKSERDNITPDELKTLREIGSALLDFNDEQIRRAIADGELKEMDHGGSAEAKSPGKGAS